MKNTFLCKNPNCDELIVVFGGFTNHPSHFLHLKSEKNVVLFYDFENLDFEFDFKAFSKIKLIAFSMGVCLANYLLKEHDFDQKIAVNGTNLGIDKEKGIHPALFSKTIKKFNLESFKNSLFKNHKDKAKNFIFKDENALKNELNILFEFALKEQKENLIWDKIYSSNQDEIFPQNALKKSFENLIFLNEPHFAFFHFHSWDEF
ncbi:pimeloyl-ACP methyl esterase BioG family protein [Campylobacter estrildidarum]|uniref:DUF452 domain-containing protein n=1 Tax=Campylobacter estrildidarum TaxID=2510189 RepID=A0A4U7BL66_9BACT|nr:pimeloyl-ACP methyl esterase BioG family protein [Campylobacter estrildidarum]TKX31251.1 DUF452 domain-containing protein [Campylobacter estrildidarum]